MGKAKVKLVIDKGKHWYDFEGKLPELPHDALLNDTEEFANAMEGAEWSDDPGTGRAILMADGRELVNPISIAPPASIRAAAAEPSVNDLVERALKRHFEQLKADDEIDSIEDFEDFPEDEDWTPFSQYEIVLRDEAPAIPKDVTQEDVDLVVAEAVKAEAAAAAPPKKPSKKPPAEAVNVEEPEAPKP